LTPDVVGSDTTGTEQLIIEAKFWVGLTEKQPGAYLERLQAGQPGVVLVVAPAARLLSLWPELLISLAAYTGDPVSPVEYEPGRYELRRPSGHVLALRSWRAVLDEMDSHLRAAEQNDWLADLAQLRRLTEREEEPDFKPLVPLDLDIQTARQVSSLFPLVKRLVDEFNMSGTGLAKIRQLHSPDPLWFGWELHSNTPRPIVWVGLYLEAWTKFGLSPLWADVYADGESGWSLRRLHQVLSAMPLVAGPWEDEKVDGGALLVPLMLRRSAVEDDVIADLKAQLSGIVEAFDRAAPDAASGIAPIAGESD
jgi:hypothetical protein